MSIHPSLKTGKGSSGALKNVNKRFERVRALFSEGKWQAGDTAYGLPKMKKLKVKSAKAKSST